VDAGPDLVALSSASEVWTMGARLRASRQYVFADWYLKPRLDLDILHTRMPSFAEKSDAPYSLRIGAMEEWTPMISPAVEIGGRLELDESTSVHPYLSLGASFTRNERLSAEAWFKGAEAGVSRFVSSVKMPGTLLDVGLGVQLFNSEKYELRAEARSRIGKDFLEQEGSLRFSVRF
jgi:outer membrane autotransporter protein